MQEQFKKANGDIVDRSDWHWEFEAEYKDGSIHKQFDNGLALGFFDVDQNKLKSFSMTRYIHKFTMDFPEGAKLIHKRRTTTLKSGSTVVVSYLFGYELGKEVVLHEFIQHIDDNWLMVSSTDKHSTRWLN